jgi:hypothetical protein
MPLIRRTVGDWLEAVLPHLGAALASEPARDRLLALGHHLPAETLTALEIRLAPADAGKRVDLALRCPSAAAALDPANATLDRPHAPQDAAWPPFVHRWAGRPPWRTRAPALWLEYDLGRATSQAPPPILCARLAAGTAPRWVAATLLPAMLGRLLPSPQRRLLLRCWREIPAPARPLYVFALLSRPGAAIRLELGGGLDLTGAAAYLRRLGAPGPAARVAGLRPLLVEADRLHLSLDLGEEISPRVGIEVSFPHQPDRDPRWRRLLDRLVAARLCSPEARDAALAWPGQDSLWSAAARWPAGPGTAATRCVRGLSHVKLVCDRHRPPSAKLYLLFAPVPPHGS